MTINFDAATGVDVRIASTTKLDSSSNENQKKFNVENGVIVQRKSQRALKNKSVVRPSRKSTPAPKPHQRTRTIQASHRNDSKKSLDLNNNPNNKKHLIENPNRDLRRTNLISKVTSLKEPFSTNNIVNVQNLKMTKTGLSHAKNNLPSIENCEIDDKHIYVKPPRPSRNMIKQWKKSVIDKVTPEQQKHGSTPFLKNIDWKYKLNQELELYQAILNQREQFRLKNHNQRLLARKSQPLSAKMNRDKEKSLDNRRTELVKMASLSTEDSFDESWNEMVLPSDRETSPTTTSTAATATSDSTPVSSANDRRSLCKTSRSTENSQSHDSSKSMTNKLLAKRRSCSFKRNVKVITPYEKILSLLENDLIWQKEIAFGRRIGLYRFKGDIGNGNFSQVKVAFHTLTKGDNDTNYTNINFFFIKERVAVKILDKSRLDLKTQKMLVREIRTMETLHHPNLIRIFEVIESLTKHYIVMELASGGELFQVISANGRFSDKQASFYFSQIVSAIDHMHQHNLIHRDIKAENVFFADWRTVKVGDFGFSTRISSRDELLSTFCGSPPYAAPELFRDENYRGPYVDFWALGVLLYFIITGVMPFRAQNIVSLKKLILECRYDIPSFVSVECCQLITGFLQLDPLKRYNLEQARSTRWLQNQKRVSSLPKYELRNSLLKFSKYRQQIQNEHSASSSASSNNSQRLRFHQPRNRHSIHGDVKYISSSLQNPVTPSHSLNMKMVLAGEEKETFRRLMMLGINERILFEHLDKGSHSHIVGTFRIIMHKILKESYENQQSRMVHNRQNQSGFNLRRSISMNIAPPSKKISHHHKFEMLDSLQMSLNEIPKARVQIENFVETSPNHSNKNSLKSSTKSHKINSCELQVKDQQSIVPTKRADLKIETIVQSIENKPVSPDLEFFDQKEINDIVTKLSNDNLTEKISTNLSNFSERPNRLSRFSRSFRALRQMLLENNICHTSPVVEKCGIRPQILNNTRALITKPHVIHKTATLQIVPHTAYAATAFLWPPRKQNKLRRSQTTPNVSVDNENQHPHSCQQNHRSAQHRHSLGMRHWTLDQNGHILEPRSKKSVTSNTRCTIV